MQQRAPTNQSGSDQGGVCRASDRGKVANLRRRIASAHPGMVMSRAPSWRPTAAGSASEAGAERVLDLFEVPVARLGQRGGDEPDGE